MFYMFLPNLLNCINIQYVTVHCSRMSKGSLQGLYQMSPKTLKLYSSYSSMFLCFILWELPTNKHYWVRLLPSCCFQCRSCIYIYIHVHTYLYIFTADLERLEGGPPKYADTMPIPCTTRHLLLFTTIGSYDLCFGTICFQTSASTQNPE